MQIATSGIILKEMNTGEANKNVAILAKDLGVIYAGAKGARRLKNTYSSSLSLFCYSNFRLFKNREWYTVDYSEPVQSFYGLREDIEKMSLAGYIAQLTQCLSPQPEEAESFLRLMLNTLHMIEKGKRPLLQAKAVYELRSLSMAGFMPDLVSCARCGEYETDYVFFSPTRGNFLCERCAGEEELSAGYLKVPKSILFALRHIVYSPAERVYSFTLSQENLKVLSKITEYFVLAQTDRTYHSLDFFNGLYTL